MTDEHISSWKDIFKGSELIIFGLVISIVLVFMNSFTNDFVSDDIGSVVESAKITDLGSAIVNGSLANVLFSVIHTFAGLHSFIYHFNSVFWHIGVSILVFFIIRILSNNKNLAAICAFLFALHPLHTEAVSWISGLPYLLYSFFGLLSFLLFILVDKILIKKVWVIPSAILAYISYFSSEKAIMLSLLFFLYVVVFSSWKKRIGIFVPIIITTLLYGLKLSGRIGQRIIDVNPAVSGGTVVFNPIIQIPVAITMYLKLLFIPLGLTLYHEDLTFNIYQFLFFLAITLLLIIITLIFLFKKKRMLFFACAFFVIALSPTLLPIQISWVVAERYMYLPSLGFIIVVAYGLLKLKEWNTRVFWSFLTILLIVYSILTIRRNLEWTNQDTLWVATIRESPSSTLALNNIGDYYGRHGDITQAIAAFQRAIEIRPTYAEATHNLGNAYALSGDATKAAQMYQRALQLKPTLIESAVNLAAIYAQRNDYVTAEKYLFKALEVNPNSPIVMRAYAAYLYQQGKKDQAIAILQKILTLYPNNIDAQQSLQYIMSQK